ncbi:MAG: hypothetical protein EZS28_031061, partial [Streblomastix strix]
MSNSKDSQWSDIYQLAKQKRELHVEKGLKPEEISKIERKIGCKFPPDFVQYLSEGFIIGKEFINWRKPNIIEIEAIDNNQEEEEKENKQKTELQINSNTNNNDLSKLLNDVHPAPGLIDEIEGA